VLWSDGSRAETARSGNGLGLRLLAGGSDSGFPRAAGRWLARLLIERELDLEDALQRGLCARRDSQSASVGGGEGNP
jgi:hypothetical protein